MCGIVGYVGNKEAIPILLEGLHCLEYRGYDSSGVAIHDGNKLNVIKSVGKIEKLEELLKKDIVKENGCGIGHTRWATHGMPSDVNAHPHLDSDQNIVVVHNGIIRNFHEVRERLKSTGVKFVSDTDTEVIVQLIAYYYKDNKDIFSSIQKAVNELDGSYAIGVMFKSESDKIYAVRKESPLVIGLGENENYIASDTPTVSRFVDKVVRLGDNEIAEISKQAVRFYSFTGENILKQSEPVTRTKDFLDKRGFKHYLAKEINEQPEVISNLLSGYGPTIKNETTNTVQFPQLNLDADYLKNIDRIIILACGTAYHAGLVGKFIIERLIKKPVEVILASEFLSMETLLTSKSLVIGISQSGETADTLAAVNKALLSGAKLVGITNRDDSHLAHLAKDSLILMNAGVEVSVAATKTFIAQLMILYQLAIYISDKLNVNSSDLTLLKNEIRFLPQLIDQTLSRAEYYMEQVIKYSAKPDFVFIGRGINFPIALEAALKLKELSYIHASGYASGEMKHGPIAVLDPNVPVVSIVAPGETYERVFQNSIEAKSRRAPMIAVAVDGDKKIDSVFDTVLHIPPVHELLSPFITVLPLQFLAYYIAEHIGCDVDQPRNLAKSVTVE